MLKSRRGLAVVAATVAALMLGLAGGTASQADTLDPAQDPFNNPPIAAMPDGATTAGIYVGAKSSDGSQVVSQKIYADQPHRVDVGIKSVAMGNIVIPVRLDLPVSWNALDTKQKFPVAIFLHGGNDNYTSWTRETDLEKDAAQYQVIVATPEGGRAAHYTNYFNSKSKGGPLQWETFHLTEMLQILQNGFHANTNRAIMGNSSGGFGSMSYAIRQPKLFKFAGVMSGPIKIMDPTQQLLILATPAADTASNDRFGDPTAQKANWEAHDPYTMASRLKGLSLFVSSGLTGLNRPEDADTFWTPIQLTEFLNGSATKDFVARLKALKIPATTDLYDLGQHNWPSWRIELAKSWPQMMKAISAKPAA